MSEYYNVIHFLNYDNLDKCYACQDYFYNFDEDIAITQSEAPYLFETNRSTFSRIEYVDVILECSESFQTSDLTFSFSILKNGRIPSLTLNADKTLTVNPNELVSIRFTLVQGKTMSEAAKILTGIQSVLLSTPNENFTIHDIIFCNDHSEYSLEELDKFIEDGEFYVNSRLSMISEEIPETLLDYKYTAAAGYAWLAKWEFDSRIMNDEQKNAKSYGKWLFSVVDDAIENYFTKIGYDESIDYVQPNLVGYEPLDW